VSDDSDGSGRYILQSGGGTIEVDDLLTLTMNGVISGSGDLTKTGDGTLILEGINTFEGNAYANAGKLTVSKASSSPSMENTTCSSGASSNRCDTSAEKPQEKLKALLGQPNQEIKSINSSSLLTGNTANSDGANDSSTAQVLGSQPSSTVSGSTSLAGSRSIEGVELSLSDSFILSNEDTSGGSSENVSSLSTNLSDASDDGNDSGAEALKPSATEESSELLSTTDQSKDEESSQANLSLSSDTSSVLSGNTNVILVPRTEVESRFILAEKKSSLYASNVLNLSSSGKPPSLSNLQSFLAMMRNNIVNSN
jgi:autotransporter-associated beta strand protein